MYICYMTENCYFQIKLIKKYTVTALHTTANGIPMQNLSLRVLWRKSFIPMQQPIPPNKNATEKRTDSGILMRCTSPLPLVLAMCLSAPIIIKATEFISTIYIQNNFSSIYMASKSSLIKSLPYQQNYSL